MEDLDDLRRLLDGDVDAEELANNPTLASIAERVYGINIEPMKISKPSQMSGVASVSSTVSTPVGELSTDPLDLMVEVVEGDFPLAGVGSPSMDLPGLLPPVPGIKPVGVEDSNSGFGKIRMGVLSILFLEILNLFGMDLPGLLPPVPGIKPVGVEDSNSGFGKIRMGVLSILFLEILNLFGVFGTLFGTVCSSGICPTVGRTRINLLSIGDIGSGYLVNR